MSYLCRVSKKWRNINASGLLVVYSLALSLVCSYGYGSYSAEQVLQKNGAENYQSIVTGNQPGAALLANKPAEAGFSTTHIHSKKSFQEFLATLKSVDRQLASSFTQYHFVSSTIAIRHRKADIIFPFHYFW